MESNVKIRRIGEQPATCVSYSSGKQMQQWYPDPKETEFEVNRIIAHAAIESGLFELVPATPESAADSSDQTTDNGGAQTEPAKVDAPKKTTRRAAGDQPKEKE